nr:unnamed protein product [Callosobruchus analis]
MFHVYWPATACLTLLLIVVVIILMLRFGNKWCRLRHTALPDREWQHEGYEGPINYSV